jgi:hypothetical protein
MTSGGQDQQLQRRSWIGPGETFRHWTTTIPESNSQLAEASRVILFVMPDLASDDFWQEYEKASEAHRRAMESRLKAERALARTYSEEALEQWNAAARQEDTCYEELKAAERVVWAKYKNV